MTIRKSSLSGASATRQLIDQLNNRVNVVQNGLLSASNSLTPFIYTHTNQQASLNIPSSEYTDTVFIVPTLKNYNNVLLNVSWAASTDSTAEVSSFLVDETNNMPLQVGAHIMTSTLNNICGNYMNLVPMGGKYSIHMSTNKTGVSMNIYNWNVLFTCLYLQ